ncbi:hypothetical protein VPH35_128571 [Triticum aestivum]|uniref:putative F-box/LRR-repeat protein At5g02930 n=1 Tax=Triticum aestivum TaxID=4565 RepID=UPI000843CA2D|nr:putative F-box/LRR-repeat protein At5g02930 [Triticum aestivum]XP_044434838.1 putative F-box/LRR-repeat protein At5g02930 [Triticum aestivum]
MEVGGGAPEEPRPRSRSRRQPHRLRGAYKRLLLLLSRVSVGLRIQSHKKKLNIDQGEDRISALPDHLLLGILERLDLRDAVRAGAASRRWRHLPHRLSRLHLDVRHFHGAFPAAIMEEFTAATCRLLSPPAERECALKTLVLDFFPVSDDLSTLGRAVEDLVTHGETECLEFHICSPYEITTGPQRAELRQRFMSFSRACPVAFGWLTKLTLSDLAFRHSQVTDLIASCDRLKHLALSFCSLDHSPLKIDAPHSGIQELEFINFACTRIELVSVPKLRKVCCLSWLCKNPPVRFGYVPELNDISLRPLDKAWHAPFALSECLPRSARNLSNLCLVFFFLKRGKDLPFSLIKE